MSDDELLFKIRMSSDGLKANLVLESKEPITYGMLIDALRDLADELSRDETDDSERH